MAAAMSGGMTVFMFMTFFFGILGYVNAMVAQHLGAGKKGKCSVVVTQAMALAIVFYPLLIACRPLGLGLFRVFGHSPEQFVLESQYFGVLIYGGIFSFMKVGFGSFFSGIGRTRVVMGANLVAMGVNIVANYVLIFGTFGFPAMGITGAAIGTVIGSATGALVLALAYVSRRIRDEFGTTSGIRLDLAMMRKFLRFGAPSGLEFLLNMVAFNLVVQLLHSYGGDVAAAITIVFSWDMVSFIPMLGVHIGVMSLVGRYMGAGDPPTAARSAYSGLAFAFVYSGVLALLFLFMPGILVGVFIQEGPDSARIADMAVPMLRLVTVYLFSDGLYLVFSGALKGAGDTRWAMFASIAVHWLLAGTAVVLIGWLHVTPIAAWSAFVFEVLILGGIFCLRFVGGKWRSIKIVEISRAAEETVTYIDVPTIEGSWD